MPEQRTMNDLLTMQAWPLDRKISVTQTRLVEWVQRYNGEIYISFSGGKDSTVLADLAARVYKATQRTDPLTLVFVNTVSAPVIKCKKTPRKKCSFVAEMKGKR